jgi:polysaccharide export outer membrane protein
MKTPLQKMRGGIEAISKRMAVLQLLFFALTPALLLVGCASPHAKVTRVPVQPEVIQSLKRFRKEYVLMPGDQIEVLVRRVPEVSHSVVIRPDGNISLPLLQDVKAAGLTPQELNERLTNLFSKRLTSPEVTVIPTQVRQSMVYVVGDINVGAGTAVPFRDAPTALQAITIANGLRRSAAIRDLAIIRLSEDGFLQAIRVGTGVGGQPGPYMAMSAALLQPDDIVFVPESQRSQFGRFLDDFVNRPLQGINGALAIYANYKLVAYLPSP